MKYTVFACCLLIAAPGIRAAEAPGEATLAGKVAETMDAASYTYVRIDTGTNNVWAAAPRFPVKVGDAIRVAEAMPMPKYRSKVLNRDFDVVYFTADVLVNGKRPAEAERAAPAELPAGHPPLTGSAAGTGMPSLPAGHPPLAGQADTAAAPQMPKDHPQVGGTGEKAKVDLSGVRKAPGGQTIAEVYANKARLSGKPVKVRGKVVRYNAQIMGRNWVHIQDGTGKAGGNDLLVTTSSEVKVGDTIIVSGNLALNKDFGANYKYPVMIENARVAME